MKRSRFTEALKLVGLVDLILSAVISLFLFATLFNYPSKEQGFLFLLSIGIAFQGIVAYVLFNVIAEIADDLAAMREESTEEEPIL